MAAKSICIVGPGAIGGMMAVLFERAGFAVSALARPERAAAIGARGIVLRDGEATLTGRPRVATRAAEIGPQDIVVVTLKSAGLRAIAPELPALCKPDTPIVFVMNGVPWWFFDGFGGALAGRTLAAVDPDGFLARTVPRERIVWGVIDCPVTEEPDGAWRHRGGSNLQLGRPRNEQEGLATLVQVFTAAGYTTTAPPAIRDAIWSKLQGNITVNPLSALTGATLDKVLNDPLVLELAVAIAREARAVALKLGLDTGPDPEPRLRALPAKLGPSKTSMLQDAERGRPFELDSIMEAAVEIGELLDVSMPRTRAVLGLARVRSRMLAGAA